MRSAFYGAGWFRSTFMPRPSITPPSSQQPAEMNRHGRGLARHGHDVEGWRELGSEIADFYDWIHGDGTVARTQ